MNKSIDNRGRGARVARREEGADGGVREDLPTFSVAGSVIDFRTGEVLTDTAMITVEGLVPAPAVAHKGDIPTRI